MLYKSDKDVRNAVCPLKGGSAKAESLLASSLPLNIDRPVGIPDSPLKSRYLSLPLTRQDLTQG